MQNSIKLFNPEENVFGELSNHFKQKFDINKQKWDSVTQYIYTSVIDSLVYQNIVKNIPIKFIIKKSSEFSNTDINNSISLYLNEALTEKFKNEKIANVLISTGELPIFYISNNTYLGINEKGEGDNLYGNKLMQIRATLKAQRIEKEKENKENELYKSYKAYTILKREFENGVILDKYNNLSIEGIINKYLNSHKDADIEKALNIPPKNAVLELINFNFDLEDILNISLQHPEIFLLKIKSPEELLRLKYKQEFIKKDMIFNLYVDGIIRKNYSSLTEDKYKIAKDQQFKNLPFKKRELFINEILRKYNNRELNSELLDRINLKIKDLYIPNDSEIRISKENANILKKYETKKTNQENNIRDFMSNKEERILLNKLHDELNVPEKSRITWEELKIENPQLANEIITYVKTNEKSMLQKMIDDVVFLTKSRVIKNKEIKTVVIRSLDFNNVFSLINTYMIKIKDLYFPTVSHYISLCLISKKTKLSLKDAYYKYMLINPNIEPDPSSFNNFVKIDKLNEIYFQVGNNADKEKLRNVAKIALDAKFRNNKHLQELLLSTGNKLIVWFDYDDNILGIGKDKNGENFVGKYLMELRRQISQNIKEDVIENNITDSDMLKIIENDHIQKWIIMKIKDVCKTIQFVKKYKKIKVINAELVENILDKIYQPCSYLFNISKDIETSVPGYFKDIVANMGSSYKDDLTCSPELNDEDISILIWKRIFSILYVIVNNLNTSSDKEVTMSKILNTLYISQIVGSTDKNCVEIITNRENNCIVSAIANLLQNILEFNKKLNKNNIIAKSDVNLAASIIINFDITQIQQHNFFSKSKIDIMDENEQEVEATIIDEEPESEQPQYDEDDDDEKSEIDYEGEESDVEDEKDGYSNKKPAVTPSTITINNIKYNEKDMKKLSFYLQENNIGEIEHDNIAKYILQCAVVIKNFKMPTNIKKNRINFFSK